MLSDDGLVPCFETLLLSTRKRGQMVNMFSGCVNTWFELVFIGRIWFKRLLTLPVSRALDSPCILTNCKKVLMDLA